MDGVDWNSVSVLNLLLVYLFSVTTLSRFTETRVLNVNWVLPTKCLVPNFFLRHCFDVQHLLWRCQEG